MRAAFVDIRELKDKMVYEIAPSFSSSFPWDYSIIYSIISVLFNTEWLKYFRIRREQVVEKLLLEHIT